MSVHKGDGGSADEGYGSGGSGNNNFEHEDESEGEGSNHAGSGSECGESCSDNEESGSGSSSGSSSSESDEETPKAKPDQLPPKAPPESEPNASQATLIPEVNDQDSEDEWQSYRHNFACSQDVDFGKWRDCMISEGHEEWAKQDKMIFDPVDPPKRAKHPDLLGMSTAYMESRDTFKAIKTSKYGLCHFYQVGTLGDFPPFPEPREPMMSDDVCHLLQKACEKVWPNVVVTLSQDAITAIALLRGLHNHVSLQWLKMDQPLQKLSFCPHSTLSILAAMTSSISIISCVQTIVLIMGVENAWMGFSHLDRGSAST